MACITLDRDPIRPIPTLCGGTLKIRIVHFIFMWMFVQRHNMHAVILDQLYHHKYFICFLCIATLKAIKLGEVQIKEIFHFSCLRKCTHIFICL
jgi:hypothetical protein